jgi:CheY-like chemotaxis protein
MTSAQPYSLLITDDDPRVREALRDIVVPAGYRALLAESGEQAIDIVQRQEVHLALMDMHLPRLTGLEAMEICRQLKGPLPTILISAEHDENLMRKALSAHVFCVLSKPVSRNAVIYVVNRAIEKFY